MFNPNTLKSLVPPAAVALIGVTACTSIETAPNEAPVCVGISQSISKVDNTTATATLTANVLRETRSGEWAPDSYQFDFGDGNKDDEEDAVEDHRYKREKTDKVYTVSAWMVMDALAENHWVKDGQRIDCPKVEVRIPGTQSTVSTSPSVVAPAITTTAPAANRPPVTTSPKKSTTR